jgi:hypothetical protein
MIPMFRADFLHGTSKSVEVSPNLPPRCDVRGKLGEYSDKLGPIVENQAEASDRRAMIRSRSGLSFTADGNLYCSFLLKNGLLPCKTLDFGNLSEYSPTKKLGEYSNTEAIHAHFCPNIDPIYQYAPEEL